MRDETKCLHSGYTPKNSEPRVVPIVQSTTYVYDSTEEVASVFDEPTKSLIYSRFANPTVMTVENKIAELEAEQNKTPPVIDYKEKLEVLRYALEQYTDFDADGDIPDSVIEAFVENP